MHIKQLKATEFKGKIMININRKDEKLLKKMLVK